MVRGFSGYDEARGSVIRDRPGPARRGAVGLGDSSRGVAVGGVIRRYAGRYYLCMNRDGLAAEGEAPAPPKVYLIYGPPTQRRLRRITQSEQERVLREGVGPVDLPEMRPYCGEEPLDGGR